MKKFCILRSYECESYALLSRGHGCGVYPFSVGFHVVSIVIVILQYISCTVCRACTLFTLLRKHSFCDCVFCSGRIIIEGLRTRMV